MPLAEKMRVKLCLLGEGGVSKTSLIRRFPTTSLTTLCHHERRQGLKDRRSTFDEGNLAPVAAEYHAPCHFTSAKTGENVQGAFEKLARTIAG